MKKRKIVNKTKFYKTMFTISLIANFVLVFTLLANSGILSKVLDYILIIYLQSKFSPCPQQAD